MSKPISGLIAWVLLIFVIWSGVYVLAGEKIERSEELRQTYLLKRSLLERLERLPRRESEIRRQLADLGNEEASKFLYSGDHQSTQVMIQRDIRQLAKESALQIASMRSLNQARTDARLIPATVQVNVVTNHNALVNFFAALENAEPMLKISKMSINTQRPSTVSQPALLRAMIEVNGFREATGGNQSR